MTDVQLCGRLGRVDEIELIVDRRALRVPGTSTSTVREKNCIFDEIHQAFGVSYPMPYH
ncbi:hypothetical protein KIN20_036923 [Parelaphostrongylus tenuis]|uniref:Uncharacterized protein n=1 Tax=Parelaphostrongylus tenuis TaxID=148309 RepID=A0AAD5WLL1_PARTN|nr:hypothetical protein KIN20_036923 [Parelaphostrongylus tenuis]